MATSKPGKVYLIGAGPGDPGLITLKGRELLSRAEVVIYDRLASPRLLSFARPDAERIYVGKRTGRHTVDQDGINKLIVEKAREGKLVARLKGGDPFIFGRGGEEAQVLAQEGIPFEVVPGVTSAIAVPAYAGIPLTHRAHTASVAFITGHRHVDRNEADIDWENLAKGVGTLVFLMGVKNLPFIVEQLMSFGRRPDTPVAVIRWGTTPLHRSVSGTLSDIVHKVADANLKPPAIIVIGDVVSLREEINWYEKSPLLSRRVLVTRTREQASDLIRLLEERGALCLECPTIEVDWPEDLSGLDEAIEALPSYDWVIFSSTNAVRFFLKRLFQKGHDLRLLGGIALAAVGSSTAEALRRYNLKPDLVPGNFTAEGLLEAFRRTGKAAKQRILIPRAKKAREILPEGLRALGAEVRVATAYETKPPQPDPRTYEELGKEPLDVVTFTSSSTVKNLFKLLPEDTLEKIFTTAKVACIGPITAKTAKGLGLEVHIMPGEHTIPALVGAIEDYFRTGRHQKK